MSGKSAFYDQDFYAWSSRQAALRAGKMGQVDIAHLDEEVENIG
jgi:hypothetical protein